MKSIKETINEGWKDFSKKIRNNHHFAGRDSDLIGLNGPIMPLDLLNALSYRGISSYGVSKGIDKKLASALKKCICSECIDYLKKNFQDTFSDIEKKLTIVDTIEDWHTGKHYESSDMVALEGQDGWEGFKEDMMDWTDAIIDYLKEF